VRANRAQIMSNKGALGTMASWVAQYQAGRRGFWNPAFTTPRLACSWITTLNRSSLNQARYGPKQKCRCPVTYSRLGRRVRTTKIFEHTASWALRSEKFIMGYRSADVRVIALKAPGPISRGQRPALDFGNLNPSRRDQKHLAQGCESDELPWVVHH